MGYGSTGLVLMIEDVRRWISCHRITLMQSPQPQSFCALLNSCYAGIGTLAAGPSCLFWPRKPICSHVVLTFRFAVSTHGEVGVILVCFFGPLLHEVFNLCMTTEYTLDVYSALAHEH